MKTNGRVAVVIVGLVLTAIAVALWMLPVLAPDEALVRERVITHEGATKTTKVSQHEGWDSLHSETIAIGLLGLGFFFVALGVLPPGVVASIKTPFGEVKFTVEEVAEVAGQVAKEVPKEEVTEYTSRALRKMGRRGVVEVTESDIDATIREIIEEEAAGGENGEGGER